MQEILNKHRMIMTEALNIGMVGGAVGSIRAKLKGIASVVGDWARGRIRPEAKIPLVAYNAVVKDLAGARFSDVATTKVTVPRGLKGGLAEYSESLFDALVKIENLEEEVLKPFSIWLSLRIASPETLASAATITDLKNFKEQDVEGARGHLSKFVDPTGRVDALPVQQVYQSLSGVKPVWDNANALATRYLETNPTRIVKQVQEIADKINRVIVILENGKDTAEPNLSAQTATILSGITLNMSQAVDLYGNLGILIRELAVACQHQVYELKKPLEDSRKLSMAKESFVEMGQQTLLLGGINIPFSFIADDLEYMASSQELPVKDLAWIFEHVPFQPLIGDSTDSWTSVGAIRLGEHLYPVTNLQLLGAAHASGQTLVPVRVRTVEEIVNAYSQR